ncbi:hypothetical protein ACOIXN_003120, partial [Vibrio vulnificus]
MLSLDSIYTQSSYNKEKYQFHTTKTPFNVKSVTQGTSSSKVASMPNTKVPSLSKSIAMNSGSTELGMLVMGRLSKLGNTEWENFGSTSESENGSILNIENWSVEANDYWIMGGVKNGVDFHLASSEIDRNLIVSESYNSDIHRKDRMITVTGRELIGLSSFGYEIHNHEFEDKLGTVLTCSDLERAEGINIGAYQESVDRALNGKVSDSDSNLFKRIVNIIH